MSRTDGFYSFMSYSTRDDEVKAVKPFIDAYVNALRDHVPYIPIFYDHFYIPDGHPNLHEYLSRCIFESDFTTAFLSPGYASSAWCALEWGHSEALSRSEVCSEKPLRHAILPIRWKGTNDRDLFMSVPPIDVSGELSNGDFRSAVDIAVEGTLRFLDRTYG